MMERNEKMLYHQIHPAKLLTDWGTAFLAAWLLWQHRPLPALVVAFLPSVLVTALFIRFGRLDWLKNSSFGKYVAVYMTKTIELLRFAGVAVFWVGAWMHQPLLAAAGILVILAAWARGILWPRRERVLAQARRP